MGANICIRTCACVHMWFEQERARATTRAQEFEGVRVKEATASTTAAATARERVWATRGHEKAREGEEGGKKATATVREVGTRGRCERARAGGREHTRWAMGMVAAQHILMQVVMNGGGAGAREGEEGREGNGDSGARGQGQVTESTHDGKRVWWLPDAF
jgi:hypothetical protein